jgi:hypothetical protein
MKNLIFVTMIIISAATGCSQNVRVEGQVAFSDGTPLELGRVVFENDKYTFTGRIQSGGTFSVGQLKDGQGVPRGLYRVYIAETIQAEPVPDAPKSGTPNGIPARKLIRTIAEKYSSPDTSGLEYDIRRKTTDIKIVVEKPE